MGAAEKLRSKRLYKLMIITLKIIPMLLALCELCNTITDFLGLNIGLFSFIGGISLLPLLFLYLTSYAFRFCEYHRMFLHYILATNILNIFDAYVGIPVSNRGLLGIHCILICTTLFLILYFYRRERCCKR